MISRRAAAAIAQAYFERFTYYNAGSGRIESKVYRDDLYDFLYENDFDSWFLNCVKKLSPTYRRQLKELLMRLHTGETVQKVAPSWSRKQREALGQRLLRELAQALITLREDDSEYGRYRPKRAETVDEMRRALELDGYVYRSGTLLIPEESVLDETEEQGVIGELFAENSLHGRDTLIHHLELSASHYSECRWDDSISNSRKVLELVLRECARKHASENSTSLDENFLSRPARVREYLVDRGLIEEKEKLALASIYGLLSNTGGHPYIAEKDQARLLRHYSLTTCQFVLLRLRGALAASS